MARPDEKFLKETGVGFIREYGRETTAITANKTMAIADQGILWNVTATGKTITLPATVVGYRFEFVCGADGVSITISPNANDLIAGNGFTAADNKDVLLSTANARKGDRIKVVGNGTTGWNIDNVVGTWTREA
jgi:hypothetical protein